MFGHCFKFHLFDFLSLCQTTSFPGEQKNERGSRLPADWQTRGFKAFILKPGRSGAFQNKSSRRRSRSGVMKAAGTSTGERVRPWGAPERGGRRRWEDTSMMVGLCHFLIISSSNRASFVGSDRARAAVTDLNWNGETRIYLFRSCFRCVSPSEGTVRERKAAWKPSGFITPFFLSAFIGNVAGNVRTAPSLAPGMNLRTPWCSSLHVKQVECFFYFIWTFRLF